MKEFNDSNADCSQNGISVFLDPVNTDEDVYISSSCVFLSGLESTGKIKAQYRLIVYGSLEAGSTIDIGGDLECQTLRARSINIGGTLKTSEDISCEEILVANDAIVGSLYASHADVRGNLIVSGQIDVIDEIRVLGKLISTDFVQAKKITAPYIVADEVETNDEYCGKQILFNGEIVDTTVESEIQQHSIARDDLHDIFDAKTPLAVTLEDCAMLLDKLNDTLCDLQYDDGELIKYLEAYGGFFTQYADLCKRIEDIKSVVVGNNTESSSWYSDFNACASFLLSLPTWFEGSQFARIVHDKLIHLIDSQDNVDITTHSKQEWVNALFFVTALRSKLDSEASQTKKFNQLREKLFKKIGLKLPSVDVNLPNE